MGTQKLVLRFDHQEYGERIAVDSTQIGLEARSAIPRMQGWNSTENASRIRGLHPIKCEH